MAHASSTPPAPPPTTATLYGAGPSPIPPTDPEQYPATNPSSITSIFRAKDDIGFTGVVKSSTPAMPLVAGVMPTLMERTSYPTPGRLEPRKFSSSTRCAFKSMPTAEDIMTRAFANLTSRLRSM